MKKLIIGVLFLGVLVAVGFRLYEEMSASQAAAADPAFGPRPMMLVETAKVAPVVFESGLEVLGELRPFQAVDVMSRVSGRLSQVLVERADPIKKGQLVAVVEVEDLQQRIRRSEAAIGVSRAAVQRQKVAFENVEIQANRIRRLHSDKLVSDQDLEDVEGRLREARAQLDFLLAQVEESEASLRELRIQLELTEVRAPFDGYVAERFLDPGALASSGIAILNVIDVSHVKTIVPVSESEIAKVKQGLPAVIRLDAFPDREYSGRIKSISPFVNAETRTADVEIEIQNPRGELKPGMFARVSLDISSARTSLSIPRAALLTRGSGKGVYLLSDEFTTVFQPISIGRIQGDKVEVLDGLSEGTVVVTAGAQKLNSGDKVRVE